LDGILNVFKPENITSYGVIKEIKWITGEKKIGHVGTLDPMATGVLPLFIGKMTKLIPFFNLDEKTYRAVSVIGCVSTTLDREGEITSVPIPNDCDGQKIRNTLLDFVGDIEQIPPMFSAVKINGKKLYEYAREGKEIERKPRPVTIFEIVNIVISMPKVSFEVRCSKGTYIRTLVADLGEKLGTGAYLDQLTRVKCGHFFSEENAINLSHIKKNNKTDLQRNFINPKCILSEWNNVKVKSEKNQQYICQGRPIVVPPEDVRFSTKGKNFLKAMAENQQNDLIAIGDLEFSQDTMCVFRPTKVLM